MNATGHTETQVDDLSHLSRHERRQLESLRPEWMRIEVAVRCFGISRSKLYQLIADRKIKSFCLRERNKIKGIRVLSFDSLSEFLENESKAAEAEAEAL